MIKIYRLPFNPKLGYAIPVQTRDGKHTFWLKKTYAIKIGKWFFGGVKGYYEISVPNVQEGE